MGKEYEIRPWQGDHPATVNENSALLYHTPSPKQHPIVVLPDLTRDFNLHVVVLQLRNLYVVGRRLIGREIAVVDHELQG